MPIYTVEIDGKQYDLEGDRPPTEAEARAAVGQQAQTTPGQDVAALFGRDGEQPVPPREMPGSPAAGVRSRMARQMTPEQMQAVGDESNWMKDSSAAMAMPGVIASAKAVPGVVTRAMGINKARAGANIAEAVTAAKDVPLNVATSIQGPLSEIMQYKGIERMPMAVRSLAKELQSGAPLTVETARKYYPAISRMSAAEFANLTPNMQRLVGGLRAALNTGITEAADTIGKGAQYASGMKEYARAGKVAAMTESAKPALASALRKALEALGIGTGVGTAYRLFKD